jgi:hypothetical protein
MTRRSFFVFKADRFIEQSFLKGIVEVGVGHRYFSDEKSVDPGSAYPACALQLSFLNISQRKKHQRNLMHFSWWTCAEKTWNTFFETILDWEPVLREIFEEREGENDDLK